MWQAVVVHLKTESFPSAYRYWMYAAVAAGHKGFMVSNDEMRDHIFQLLAPRYFHKWKQRHQVGHACLQQACLCR